MRRSSSAETLAVSAPQVQPSRSASSATEAMQRGARALPRTRARRFARPAPRVAAALRRCAPRVDTSRGAGWARASRAQLVSTNPFEALSAAIGVSPWGQPSFRAAAIPRRNDNGA